MIKIKITSTEVVEYFLKRIESIDGKIGAIATVTTESSKKNIKGCGY